jgi:ribulose-5-phosphate 4-epimerase/fuculose-1-phosphate aldolase
MNGFVKISKYAGMREDLVQAGGGNSAFKISDDRMMIKASGFQLADMSENSGYAIVNPRIVKEAFLSCDDLDSLTDKESQRILAEALIEGAKPSIETFLHSISGKYSLHTHPIVVNALTCRKNGHNIIGELFPNSLIVPYATPGVELAKAYFKAYKEYKAENENEPRYVFLMNHGLLVSGDTADDVIELTENVTRKIESYLNVDYSAYHEMTELYKLFEDGIIWKVTDINVISSISKLGGVWDYCFCPDCVVFLGKKMYDIKGDLLDKEDFEKFKVENDVPIVILFKGNLYIRADSVKKALEIQSVLSFSAQVMTINKGVQCNMLSEEEKNFLLNWDAEKYRKNLGK